MTKHFLCLLVGLDVFAVGIATSQPADVVIGHDEHGIPWSVGNRIAIYRTDSSKFRDIVKSDDLVFWAHEVLASPDNQHVAALGTKQRAAGKERGSNIMTFLLVYRMDGTLVRTIDRCTNLAWAPNSSQVVYSTGIKYTGKPGPATDSLWIFNLEDGSISNLGASTATRIQWAAFDNRIYLTENGFVFKLNPQTKERVRTNHRDVNFSPNGEYYFFQPTDSDDLRVFDRRTDADMTPQSVKDLFTRNTAKWLPDGELLVGDITYDKIVVDIRSKKSGKPFTGMFIGYDKTKKEIIVHKNNRVFKEHQGTGIERIKVRLE